MNNQSNCSLSEKDMMQDLLTTEKQIISAYSTGVTESSCMDLRSTLVNNFNCVQDIQFKVFQAMNQKGWYPVKQAQPGEVQQLKVKSQQMINELK